VAQAADKNKTYRVLARKYRPQDFTALIGQEPMVRTLTNAFDSGRIAQAWMLTGVRGVGKTTTARILARALNYKTPTIDRPSIELIPEGEHCQAIMEGRHVDVIEMDAASHTGIDDIRDLIEQSRYRPVAARYKVYIIDEVHMLSTQAFNGLLKTLEEPPPHVKFIFATTEIRKVPITVLSRCQRFDLRRVDQTILKQHLAMIAAQEGIEAQDEALAMIARAGEGSVRDALSMLDQAIAHGQGHVEAAQVSAMLGLADRGRIIDLFEAIMRGQIGQALQLFKNLYDEGADPHVIITEMAEFNHLVTRLRITDDLRENGALSEEERVRGAQLAKVLELRTLSQNWQMLLKGLSEIDQAPRPYQAAEMLLIRLSTAVNLPPLDTVIKMVMEGKNSLPPQATNTPTSALSTSTLPVQSLAPESLPKTASHLLEKNHSQSQELEQLTPQNKDKNTLEEKNPALQAVIEEKIETKESKIKENAIEAPEKIKLDDLTAILAYADKMRDVSFKAHLKEYVRPIHIAHGIFEFAAAENAPRLLPSLIGKTLLDWTGERWTVTLKPDKGGMTINEQAQMQREILLSDASQDKDVNAILMQFPGAQIVDVKLNMADELEDETHAFALDERQENEE